MLDFNSRSCILLAARSTVLPLVFKNGSLVYCKRNEGTSTIRSQEYCHPLYHWSRVMSFNSVEAQSTAKELLELKERELNMIVEAVERNAADCGTCLHVLVLHGSTSKSFVRYLQSQKDPKLLPCHIRFSFLSDHL